MTAIRIKEFIGYSQQSLLEFLRIHNKSFFEISIPKELGEQEHGKLFLQDYFNAICVAQLLSRISCHILCTHPDPLKKGGFSFIIITGQLNKLARLLFYFCNACDWQHNQDACIQFQIAATNVDGYVKKDEECACPSYVAFMNQYLKTKGH